MGSSVKRCPVASLTALAMAAGAPITGGSPTPFAPNGPSPEGPSTRTRGPPATACRARTVLAHALVDHPHVAGLHIPLDLGQVRREGGRARDGRRRAPSVHGLVLARELHRRLGERGGGHGLARSAPHLDRPVD